MDNAGFELFTDLCLADYLSSANLVKKVRIIDNEYFTPFSKNNTNIQFSYEVNDLIDFCFSNKKCTVSIHPWVIPCEITHSKNESLPIVFILSTQSVHPMRVHNTEYHTPMTSGSRVTGCANFVN